MSHAFAKNLKMFRDKTGMRQEDIAAEMGISMTTLWKWESGQVQPRSKNIRALCSKYGLTEDDLLSDSSGLYAKATGIHRQIPAMASDTFAPILGNIAAGDPREAIEQSDEVHWVRPDLLECYPDGFFVKVAGDSMDKVIPDGAYAFVAPIEVHSGDVAVVKVNGDDVCIKRIQFAESINAVKLYPESTNPRWSPRLIDKDSPDSPGMRILGKVVWFDVDL